MIAKLIWSQARSDPKSLTIPMASSVGVPDGRVAARGSTAGVVSTLFRRLTVSYCDIKPELIGNR